MQIRNIVLVALEAFGEKIGGKTLFIKKLFFVGELLKKELGYYPHYYGPYSEEIANSITILKNFGLIREEIHRFGLFNGAGFEVLRYDYALTPEGREAVRWLRENEAKEVREIEEAARRIMEAGNLDYVDLSLAAKAYLILKQANRPLRPSDIAAEAKRFSWYVDDQQIQRGIGFLKKLGLVS